MDSNIERWYSMKEICEYLGVSRDTVLAWIDKREMPATKIGRLWKFKISEVDAWMKSGVGAEKQLVIYMDEKRLKSFEDMLKAILPQYDSTVEKMMKLKAESKEKTVTYRQLFANKLQLQATLSYYGTCGLLDDEK